MLFPRQVSRYQGFISPALMPSLSTSLMAFILTFQMFSPNAFAQTSFLNLEHLLLGPGNENNAITDIAQDQRGFLWFSTWTGVFRYDGYNLKHYTHHASDTIPARANWTAELLIDRRGHLWALQEKGISRYNPQLDKFVLMDSLAWAQHGSLDRVMEADIDGNVWVRTNDGLTRIRYLADGSIITEQDTVLRESNGALIHFKPFALHSDQNGRFWLGTDHGLWYYHPKQATWIKDRINYSGPVNAIEDTPDGRLLLGTNTAGLQILDFAAETDTSFVPDPINSQMPGPPRIIDLKADRHGNIWLLTSDPEAELFQLVRFDGKSQVFRSDYFRPWRLPTEIVALVSPLLQLYLDNQEELWVATGNGLYRYLSQTDTFQSVEGFQSAEDASLISTFLQDRTGVIWLGTTLGNGMFRYPPPRLSYRRYQKEADHSESWLGDDVKHIFEDSKKQYWVSTERGVNVMARNERGTFMRTHFFEIKTNSNRHLAGHSSRVVCEDRQGYLWLTFLGGFSRYDPVGKRFHHYSLDTNSTGSPAPPIIYDIKPFNDSLMALATYGEGLLLFSPQTEAFSKLSDASQCAQKLHAIYTDQPGQLWISTFRGFNRYRYKKDDWECYLNNIITHLMATDREGYRWITTSAHGLFRLDPQNGSYRRYTPKDGLPTHLGFDIHLNTTGKIWYGSDAGLVYFDPKNKQVMVFGERDGIADPNFMFKWFCRSSSGDILVPQGTAGMFAFHPDSLFHDTVPPQMAIVDLRVLNQSVKAGAAGSPLSRPIWDTDHLILPYDQNSLTLEFAALHYAAPQENQYAFRLDGKDEAWIHLGNNRFVNLYNLSPGTYHFQLKAANYDRQWQEFPASLLITIQPPWYWNSWSKGFYLLLVFGSLYLLYRFLLRRRLEKAEILRLQELDAFKTKFYTYITHEFRTPLTIITGMADQIREKPERWFSDGLEMIKRSGRDLLHFVNQMLELSKLEAGAIQVRLVQRDIVAYFKYLIESFYPLAESKNIALNFQVDPQGGAAHLVMDYDPDKLLHIFSNLLANAIKFTPENGEVEVSLQLPGSKHQYAPQISVTDHLEIRISDTGPGIPAEKLPHIFNHFYKTNRSGEGIGIGLALTKELVKLLGGEIMVESSVGKGTKFTITLPITQQAPIVSEAELPFVDLSISTDLITNNGESPGQTRALLSTDERPILLIIEDHEDVVLYLQSILADNYRLKIATDGQKGWHQALEFVPDIIISDVMMPVMDGFELCNKLKNDVRTSHIPIILLTAKADFPSKIEGLKRGADAYLVKPFHQQELLIRLEKLLDLRKQLQARYKAIPPISPSDDLNVQMEDSFMEKLQALLETHYSDEAFGIPELCRALLMSRAQLYRKVKALTGHPVGQVLRSFRMQKAKIFLETTDLSISQIALEVGFKSLPHFSRSFHQEFGMPPSAMRN